MTNTNYMQTQTKQIKADLERRLDIINAIQDGYSIDEVQENCHASREYVLATLEFDPMRYDAIGRAIHAEQSKRAAQADLEAIFDYIYECEGYASVMKETKQRLEETDIPRVRKALQKSLRDSHAYSEDILLKKTPKEVKDMTTHITEAFPDLSARPRNVLLQHRIEMVSDLKQLSYHQLSMFRNLGEKSQIEIFEALWYYDGTILEGTPERLLGFVTEFEPNRK